MGYTCSDVFEDRLMRKTKQELIQIIAKQRRPVNLKRDALHELLFSLQHAKDDVQNAIELFGD